MGTFSFWHWAIVLLVVLIIFGAGKLPKVAGDLALGIKNFKKGMQDKDEVAATEAGQPRSIEGGPTASAHDATAVKDKAAQS
jgi:sec-independent protein translocase protein TatA